MNAYTSRFFSSAPLRQSAFCLGLIVLTLSGCSSSDNAEDNRPARVPVSGTISYNNAPVAGATVIFSPVITSGKAASGVTDSSGRYTLTSYGNEDGAVPGDYEVMVMKVKTKQSQVVDVDNPAYQAPPAVDAKTPAPESLIPQKYSNPKTSGLRATVPSEGKLEGLDFQLTK